MSPVRYFWKKALRKGTGSRYETSRESRATTLHNLNHFFQCPSVEVAWIFQIPLEMSSGASRKLLRKRSSLEGFTSDREVSLGVWCPFIQGGKRRLGLCILMSGWIFHFTRRWKSCGEVHIGGTSCGVPESGGSGLLGRWIFRGDNAVSRGLTCYLYGQEYSCTRDRKCHPCRSFSPKRQSDRQ